MRHSRTIIAAGLACLAVAGCGGATITGGSSPECQQAMLEAQAWAHDYYQSMGSIPPDYKTNDLTKAAWAGIIAQRHLHCSQ